MKPSISANLAAIREAAKAHNLQLASQAAPAEPEVAAEPSSLPPAPPQPADGAWPPAKPDVFNVENAKPAKAKKTAAKKAKAAAAPTGLQQCNVRLTADSRERVRAAAKACHVSEQELIERWAQTLPPPAAAPKMPWEQ